MYRENPDFWLHRGIEFENITVKASSIGKWTVGKVIKKIFLIGLLVSSGVGVSLAQTEPAYNPYGVQNDVPISVVLNGGWRILYKGSYHKGEPSVAALFRGACRKIMLASKEAHSTNFDVLATIESALFVPLQTGINETISANGAQWYKNEQSMGFAGQGDLVVQTSADTKNLHERDRLSWHTIRFTGESHTRLNPGWRSGNLNKLDKTDHWERYILTSDNDNSSTAKDDQTGCIPVG